MKTCKTCGETKPLMDFYQGARGYLGAHCKPCTCAKVRANRLVRLDQYAEYERGRANLPHRVAARLAYAQTEAGRANGNRAKREYLRRNPVIRAAHLKTQRAIESGKLIRQACEVCRGPNTQAHHDDYGKPLEVRWLCTTHHAEWHKHNDPIVPRQDAA